MSRITEITRSWLIPILIFSLLGILIRIFVLQSFVITGNSMAKTLLPGDKVLISKLSDIKPNHLILFSLKNIIKDKPDIKLIKRCVGMPGDTIEIAAKSVFVNQTKMSRPINSQYSYRMNSFNQAYNLKVNMKSDDIEYSNDELQTYHIDLTQYQVRKLINDSFPIQIKEISEDREINNERIYPHSYLFRWNQDYFGPVIVPKKNLKIKLNRSTITLYKDVICNVENSKLEIKGNKYFVNGTETEYYDFKQDYYFMLNDNFDTSGDSRYWGFLPEENIIGKAILVWFSIDRNANVRWNRIFSKVN